MAVIEIIRGGCGITYTDGNSVRRHALKTAEDGPFSCEDSLAARLVSKGMAKYVGAEAPADDELEEDEPGKTDDTDEGDGSDDSKEDEKDHLDREQLESWDYNDLKKLAAELGASPTGRKKKDLIDAIVAVPVKAGPPVNPDEDDGEDEDTDEAPPAPGVALPE